ncbi:hypothetical protein E2C01_037654 [Portunus trituberculatus]|uniref:Secreted protein n=1 Tax=Portunus trituberculatus TaxID=210409 RepID=A0A5B7FF63_PORTR|nr:hypothetical protein [Portunus trituberculatus]
MTQPLVRWRYTIALLLSLFHQPLPTTPSSFQGTLFPACNQHTHRSFPRLTPAARPPANNTCVRLVHALPHPAIVPLCNPYQLTTPSSTTTTTTTATPATHIGFERNM